MFRVHKIWTSESRLPQTKLEEKEEENNDSDEDSSSLELEEVNEHMNFVTHELGVNDLSDDKSSKRIIKISY